MGRVPERDWLNVQLRLNDLLSSQYNTFKFVLKEHTFIVKNY